MINGANAIQHLVLGKHLQEAPSSVGSQGPAECAILEQIIDMPLEIVQISRADEKAGVAIDYRFPYTTHIRSDYWQPCPHRLQDGEWKSLPTARKHKDMRL